MSDESAIQDATALVKKPVWGLYEVGEAHALVPRLLKVISALKGERDGLNEEAGMLRGKLRIAVDTNVTYTIALDNALAELAGAGIPTPEKTFTSEPHELRMCIRELVKRSHRG